MPNAIDAVGLRAQRLPLLRQHTLPQATPTSRGTSGLRERRS